MFAGVVQGNGRVRDSVVLVPGQIGHIVIAPVIEEKIMEQRSPYGGVMIQFQKLAYPVSQIRHIVDVNVNRRIMMIELFKPEKFFVFLYLADYLVILWFERLASLHFHNK